MNIKPVNCPNCGTAILRPDQVARMDIPPALNGPTDDRVNRMIEVLNSIASEQDSIHNPFHLICAEKGLTPSEFFDILSKDSDIRPDLYSRNLRCFLQGWLESYGFQDEVWRVMQRPELPASLRAPKDK